MAKVTVGNDRTVDSGRNGSQTYGFYVGKAAKLTIRQINIEASNKGVGVLKSQRMRSGKGFECREAQKESASLTVLSETVLYACTKSKRLNTRVCK